MMELIRIEHPESGKGIFTHRFAEWEYLKGFFDRHNNLPSPSSERESEEMKKVFTNARYREVMKGERNEWYCAYKSLEQLLEWVLEEEFETIVKFGFRFYSIKVESCITGNYQCIFKHENIIEKNDITYLFEKIEKVSE